jgi:hypothetical protein
MLGWGQEQDRTFWQMKSLWNEDYVDFVLGGTSIVALYETMVTSLHSTIEMVCCVGPDVNQEPFPNPTIFGIQCSYTKHTQQLIPTLSILGVRTIAITYSNSLFTYTTCQATKTYALRQASVPYNLTFEYEFAYNWETSADPNETQCMIPPRTNLITRRMRSRLLHRRNLTCGSIAATSGPAYTV